LGPLTFCLLALAGLLPPPASAQGQSYCNITRITTRTRANAVEVTVQADGLMDVQWNVATFFSLEAWSRGQLDQLWKPMSVLPFRINNARSQVGPFTDVGVYPASHVEVSIPPDAREGVGVDLRVVLFRDAVPVGFQIDWEFTPPGSPPPGPTVSVTLTPDRTRLVFVITSDRQVFQADQLRGPPPGAPVSLEVAGEGGLVSVYALNAGIRDILREVAARSGLNVVADGVLERTVSLSLPAMPGDEAVDAIAAACGLTLDRGGGVIRAADGRATSLPAYEQGAFETVRLHNITAAGARAGLPDVMLRYVHLDERQNALTVTGPEGLIRKLKADLAVLDRPVPQIEVEALVVEFTSTDERRRLLRAFNGNRGETVAVDAGAGDITFETFSSLPDGFTARLDALVRSGAARLRARPRAVVRSGATAELFVGQQKYIKVSEFDPWEEVDYVRIMAVKLGVSLRATPWTGDGREILLEVAPEVSTIAEREPRTGLPTVFVRNASSTLRLVHGGTAVIGGLVEDQPERRRRRIPLLGDLPLIGGIFRYTESRRSFSDLALFVTARVLPDAAPGAAPASSPASSPALLPALLPGAPALIGPAVDLKSAPAAASLTGGLS